MAIPKPRAKEKAAINNNVASGPEDALRAQQTTPVTVPPPVVMPTRSPTSEEILENLRFMFAVGIECSNPVVQGGIRVDELEATGPELGHAVIGECRLAHHQRGEAKKSCNPFHPGVPR